MRILVSGLRGLVLAVAFAQTALPATLVVVDELLRSGEPVAPAHIDAPGTTHDYRAHDHDCVACQHARSLLVPIRRIPFAEIGSKVLRPAELGRAFVASDVPHEFSARAPPVVCEDLRLRQS